MLAAWLLCLLPKPAMWAVLINCATEVTSAGSEKQPPSVFTQVVHEALVFVDNFLEAFAFMLFFIVLNDLVRGAVRSILRSLRDAMT
ncbi:hypothetical protein ACOMHN_000751 [Nucella lapillus]